MTTGKLWMKALVLLAVMHSLAHAGKVDIRDDVGLLSATDRLDIEEAAGSIPFDVRVLVAQSARSRSAFESMVSAEVTTPRVLAIGLDPAHQQTVARFGSGLSVPGFRWNAITEAGSIAFRGKEWGRGIALIATTARDSSETVTVASIAPLPPPVVHVNQAISDRAAMWWLTGFLALSVLALIVGLAVHRRRQRELDRQQQQREDLAAADRIIAADSARPVLPRIETERSTPVRTYAAPPPPVFRVPVPNNHTTTVLHVQQSGGSDLLAGMIINEAAHQHHDAPREIVREVVPVSHDSGGSSSSYASSSSDAGGSSSSWSSSNDSGGSSSSYDSSSSGGCDSGGGSSSW